MFLEVCLFCWHHLDPQRPRFATSRQYHLAQKRLTLRMSHMCRYTISVNHHWKFGFWVLSHFNKLYCGLIVLLRISSPIFSCQPSRDRDCTFSCSRNESPQTPPTLTGTPVLISQLSPLWSQWEAMTDTFWPEICSGGRADQIKPNGKPKSLLIHLLFL